MTIQVNYTNFNESIEFAKYEIEKDVEQVITPVVNKTIVDGVEVFERFVEISIEDHRLSNVVSKRYNRKEMLELIHLYQKLVAQIEKNELADGCK